VTSGRASCVGVPPCRVPPKPDWSRPLSKPIDVGARRRLHILADVRSYLLKIPEERQTNFGWQNITRQIVDAAQSGETIDLTIPLALARLIRN
jgi:hypothetical protein